MKLKKEILVDKGKLPQLRQVMIISDIIVKIREKLQALKNSEDCIGRIDIVPLCIGHCEDQAQDIFPAPTRVGRQSRPNIFSTKFQRVSYSGERHAESALLTDLSQTPGSVNDSDLDSVTLRAYKVKDCGRNVDI